MTQVPLGGARLKARFQTALVKVPVEGKDLRRDVIEETRENVALARAIEEGRGTEKASRGVVFSLLEGGH
jgi:hypothetical protein